MSKTGIVFYAGCGNDSIHVLKLQDETFEVWENGNVRLKLSISGVRGEVVSWVVDQLRAELAREVDGVCTICGRTKVRDERND